MAKVKKPIYKRWWAWVLALFLIFAGLGADSESDNDVAVEPQTNSVAENPVQEMPDRSIPEADQAPDPKASPAPQEPESTEISDPESHPQVIVPIDITEPEPEVVVRAEPEPDPELEPEPSPVSQKAIFAVSGTNRTVSLDPDVLVWKSATGSKFHTHNDCGNMNPDKAKQITVAEAEKQGLTACEKCY